MGQLKYEIADELDMRVKSFVAEIDLKALTKYYGKARKFVPLSKFAEDKRDLCFVMGKEVTCANIEKTIEETCEYVTDIELFDIYEGAQLGEDKKSMAFSLVFTPKDKEFENGFVDGLVNDILSKLGEKYNVTLRA